MCFYYDDYDYRPEVYAETRDATAPADAKCCECRQTIPAGEPHLLVHMEQYETPREWDDDGEDFAEDDPARNDPGEVQDYRCCDKCCRVVKAVEAAELEAGCHPYNSTPPMYDLRAIIREDDHEGRRYCLKAKEMFPGIEPHLEVLHGAFKRYGE